MNDEEAIKEKILHYVGGWYEADSNRMQQALHDKLVKRRIVTKDEIWLVDKPWMITATGEGQGKIDNPKEGKKEITILDIHGKLASAKLVSKEYVDYLHLIKENNEWQIANALWDFHSEINK